MRRLHAILFVLTGFASAAAWAAPGDGIANTPHDFTINLGTTEPVGACTFCHTPHKAYSTQLLWNHTLSSSTFAWDVASTTAGTTLPNLDGQTYPTWTAKPTTASPPSA